eukprot:TRINITY_DN3267_c0_g1_i2.p1 TRINITY_DN3267_c0_g1~~TRINITY_DN3267_c0_g1_i2.p1  ORF type:complete len:472 (+),score=85.92 TRINITY_DN3267_c0_g1_i2:299-1714(+)
MLTSESPLSMPTHTTNHPCKWNCLVSEYPDHRLWTTSQDKLSNTVLIFDGVRWINHEAAKQQKSIMCKPWALSDSIFWHDDDGFEKLNKMLGKDIISFSKALRRRGFGAWISGLGLCKLLVELYSSKSIAPLKQHREQYRPRISIYTSAPLGEIERIADEYSMDKSKHADYLVMGEIILISVPPTPVQDYYHPSDSVPLPCAVYYDPYHRVLFDPHKRGLISCLSWTIEPPCGFYKGFGLCKDPRSTVWSMMSNPMGVVHYFAALFQGFDVLNVDEHRRVCSALSLLMGLYPLVMMEAFQHVVMRVYGTTQMLRDHVLWSLSAIIPFSSISPLRRLEIGSDIPESGVRVHQHQLQDFIKSCPWIGNQNRGLDKDANCMDSFPDVDNPGCFIDREFPKDHQGLDIIIEEEDEQVNGVKVSQEEIDDIMRQISMLSSHSAPQEIVSTRHPAYVSRGIYDDSDTSSCSYVEEDD